MIDGIVVDHKVIIRQQSSMVIYDIDQSIGQRVERVESGSGVEYGLIVDREQQYVIEYIDRMIYIYRIDGSFIRSIQHDTVCTTVCSSSSSSTRITVGDQMGRITHYHNALDSKQRVDQTITHWHSDRVDALCYDQKEYLYSGGSEGVIVICHQYSSKQTYCPRLEGRIRYLKSSGRQLIVVLDHQIMVLDNTNYTQICNRPLLNTMDIQYMIGLDIDHILVVKQKQTELGFINLNGMEQVDTLRVVNRNIQVKGGQ